MEFPCGPAAAVRQVPDRAVQATNVRPQLFRQECGAIIRAGVVQYYIERAMMPQVFRHQEQAKSRGLVEVFFLLYILFLNAAP